jgi:predicted outer membrane repeat protein
MFSSFFFGKRNWGMYSNRREQSNRPKGLFRPQLEALETRLAPATLVVNTTTDEFDGGIGSGNPPPGADGKLSFREALSFAQGLGGQGLQIIFDPSVFSTPQTINLTLYFGPIFFNAPPVNIGAPSGLTIAGPVDASGNPLVTIDGFLQDSAFICQGSHGAPGFATLSNLQFSHFSNVFALGTVFNISSSGINSSGDTYTFTNCIFDSNTTDGDGGAIAARDVNLNLTDCRFSNNSAGFNNPGHGYGGAIWASGGSITISQSATPVINTQLTGNTAGLDGGAIYEDGGSLTVSNASFSGNHAGGSGGAISSVNATTNISNCTVNGNSANFQGGGINIDPSAVTIISSTVNNNTAPVGADIYNLNSALTVIASTVGNISNNGGTITTPASAVADLGTQISALTQSGALTASQAAGLTSKLQAAQYSLDNGKFTPGVNQLNAFINQVNAFVKSQTLTAAQAQPMINGANQLINAVKVAGSRLLQDTGTVTSSNGDTQPVTAAGQLVTGTVGVYLDNTDGTQVSADEQARFDDAIATLDATFGSYGVNLVDVGAANAVGAVVQVEIAGTSAAGSAADGVLGCTMAGHITLLTGWNWFTGAVASAIGADQYDLETIVMHELGHAIGLGHSGDTGSVMYAYLAPGQTHRIVTTQDLSVLDSASTTPEPLTAVGWRDSGAVVPLTPSEPISKFQESISKNLATDSTDRTGFVPALQFGFWNMDFNSESSAVSNSGNGFALPAASELSGAASQIGIWPVSPIDIVSSHHLPVTPAFDDTAGLWADQVLDAAFAAWGNDLLGLRL